ncbi:MAG: type II toxin-antitoxin system RelE/ParE family toxin [DPANN group archaeon]|nr:type II toxin-antitoxin system RelE/ParE family toxin [DPANN group archaeon]
MYSIEFSNESKKFLRKLDKHDVDIILNKVYSLRENPFRNLKRLHGEKLWRLRIGDYRAIVDVLVSNNKIFVVRIGKRSRVY